MSQRTADESYIAWLQGAPPAAAGATTTIQYKVQSIFVYDACFTAQVAGQHWLRCLSAWVRGFTSRRSVPDPLCKCRRIHHAIIKCAEQREINEAEGIKSVHEAFKLGINFFDTSPFYGGTKSETVLGKALKDLPRDKIIVSTKVGRYGQEYFDFSAERVTASVQESLQRLQIPYIDIIQCHDIEFGSLDQVINETLPALQQLKAQGLVRFIGITGLPLKALQYVLDRVPTGTVDVILSYCHYCLNDTSLQDQIPYFQEKQVGIISASPLSMGLLTPQGPPEWHAAPPELKEAAKAAADYCQGQGLDIAKLAVQFAVRNPSISTTLVGMASSEVVHANVQAVLQALDIQPSEAARAEARVLEEVQRILAPVKDMGWPSGRPENQ